MAYVGGGIITIEGLDANRFCFWDLTNIVELYLWYKYNEEIYGLTKDPDFMTMLGGIINRSR
jgi:hypothetical protein